MTIVFEEPVDLEVITKDGETKIVHYRNWDYVEVQHVRFNKAFNTATILFADGSTAHGVSQMTFDIL
jgi:hypothetical protein